MRSYEVFIRKDTGIELNEWLAAVTESNDFSIPGVISITTPNGQERSVPASGFVWWVGHTSGEPVPFDFTGGLVRLTDPDDQTLSKATAIAMQLKATVIGEDGKVFYNSA